jgi:hypothetical protein
MPLQKRLHRDYNRTKLPPTRLRVTRRLHSSVVDVARRLVDCSPHLNVHHHSCPTLFCAGTSATSAGQMATLRASVASVTTTFATPAWLRYRLDPPSAFRVALGPRCLMIDGLLEACAVPVWYRQQRRQRRKGGPMCGSTEPSLQGNIARHPRHYPSRVYRLRLRHVHACIVALTLSVACLYHSAPP